MHFNHICECSRYCSPHGRTDAQGDVATRATWLLLLKARSLNLYNDYVIHTYIQVFNLQQNAAKSIWDGVERQPRRGVISLIAYKPDLTDELNWKPCRALTHVHIWMWIFVNLYRVSSTIRLLHLWLWWRHDELVVGSWMLASHSGEWCKMKAKFSDAWKNRATNYADDLWLHGSLRVNICMGLLMSAGMCGGAVCVFFFDDKMHRCVKEINST